MRGGPGEAGLLPRNERSLVSLFLQEAQLSVIGPQKQGNSHKKAQKGKGSAWAKNRHQADGLPRRSRGEARGALCGRCPAS